MGSLQGLSDLLARLQQPLEDSSGRDRATESTLEDSWYADRDCTVADLDQASAGGCRSPRLDVRVAAALGLRRRNILLLTLEALRRDVRLRKGLQREDLEVHCCDGSIVARVDLLLGGIARKQDFGVKVDELLKDVVGDAYEKLLVL